MPYPLTERVLDDHVDVVTMHGDTERNCVRIDWDLRLMKNFVSQRDINMIYLLPLWSVV